MSFKINSINIAIGQDNDNGYIKAICKYLKINSDRLLSYRPVRVSLDARKKNDIKYVCSFEVCLKNEQEFLNKTKLKDIVKTENSVYNPYPDFAYTGKESSPIIVGCGPAGLFCAYNLAKKGLKPIVIERGEDVDARISSVNEFWKGGRLNTSSNVQFGEGGAGTFSDGKLNTMIKDSTGRIREVFETFVKYGADEKILYLNKPHIGTDRLVGIVKNIRNEIIRLGGEVQFNTTLKDIVLENGSVKAIQVETFEDKNGIRHLKSYQLSCDTLVLAIGHSARDTFEMLEKKGVFMEQKPFAMGVRVQHNQDLIGISQYGESFYKKLPAADYKLTVNLEDGRGVYSFCMCPGGFVVNASSEDGRLAVNGMSNSDRSERSANSAVVVTVKTSDFPGDDCLAGMRLQRELEEKAYKCCEGRVPVESYYTFANDIDIDRGLLNKSNISEIDLNNFHEDCNINDADKNNVSEDSNINELKLLKKSLEEYHMSEDNLPNIKGKWDFGSVKEFLPEYIVNSIKDAFPKFGKMIAGYDRDDTLLIGLESRTSSPVRIVRNDSLQSENIKGLYPCGEGAGYAGGITSAAVDGLKVFEAIIQNYINK